MQSTVRSSIPRTRRCRRARRSKESVEIHTLQLRGGVMARAFGQTKHRDTGKDCVNKDDGASRLKQLR